MAASEGFPHRSSPGASPLWGLQARRGAGAAGVQPPRPRFLGEGKAASTPGFPSHKHTRHTGGAPGRVETGMLGNVLPVVGVSIPFHPAQRSKRPGGDGLGTPSKIKSFQWCTTPLIIFFFFHSAMKPRIQSANGGHFEQFGAGHPHAPSQPLPGRVPISSAGES